MDNIELNKKNKQVYCQKNDQQFTTSYTIHLPVLSFSSTTSILGGLHLKQQIDNCSSLPADVQSAQSHATFCQIPKTHLFRQTYPDIVL